MGLISNAAFDLAEFRSEEERRASVERAQAQVRRIGTMWCEGCGQDIDEERRKAAPFARRCIDCQRIHERASKR